MTRRILFDQNSIQRRVEFLAEKISEDYRDQDIVLVGLLNGCVPFLSDLGRHLAFMQERGKGVANIYLDFMKVGSYGDTHESGALRIISDIEHSVVGKHVIIVDDVADTCKTLVGVGIHLFQKGPASIDVCVCVEKPDKRQSGVLLRYVGFSKNDLPFLAGYGMDDKGRFRVVPYIFEVTGE